MHVRVIMALLVVHVDTDIISMLEIWRSDAMIRYLHTLAQGFTSGLLVRMDQHGDYALILPAHRS